MAFSTGNVIQAALVAIQAHFGEHGRVPLDFNALSFIFCDSEPVKGDEIQPIVDYLEALPWVERVHIVWDVPQLTVLRAEPT